MATSAVYYKFRSQKEPQRVTFDGTGISIWDLKREIILQNKMGKGTDFDLAVYDADTEEEYKDDNYSVPRSSHVLVRRLPPSRPGRGTAQLYVSDVQPSSGGAEPAPSAPPPAAAAPYRGPMTKRFDGRSDGPPTSTSAPGAPVAADGGDEAARIAAMFQATTEQWDETQERMAHGMPRRGPPPRAGGQGAYAAPAVDRPPPPAGYICYRCGQKGHWIQDCPTNDNQDYDNRPRFKRTTGIPKSMLRTVEQPTAEQMSGVMVTPDGSYVIATPDSDSWNRSKSRARPLSKTDVYQSVPSDPSLACPYCSKLLRDAVITPCCQTSFCEECVQTYLFEHDFLCPECEKHIQNIETLKIDDVKRKKVREYIASTIERSEEAFEQGTKVDEEANAAANEAHQAELAMQAGNESSAPPDAPKDEGHTETAPAASNDPPGAPPMPMPMPMPGAPGETPTFNPQLVQQLAVMLQNPNLPMPMRMQMQMQLQFQQMLFFQMFPPGSAPGAMPGMPGMPPMPGATPPGPTASPDQRDTYSPPPPPPPSGQRRPPPDGGGRGSKARRRA